MVQAPGGAVYIEKVEESILRDCLFDSNTAQRGGALFIDTTHHRGQYYMIEKCTFRSNRAVNPRKIYLKNNTIENSWSGEAEGGAVSIHGNSQKKVSFVGSVFINNSVTYPYSRISEFGGAICLRELQVVIKKCFFKDNRWVIFLFIPHCTFRE